MQIIHDVKAEREVLAACLNDWTVGNNYLLELDELDFHEKIHRKIFSHIRSQALESIQAIDVPSIAFDLKEDLRPLGGQDFLWEMTADYHYLDPEQVIDRLKRIRKLRQALDIAVCLQRDATHVKYEEIDDLLVKNSNQLANLIIQQELPDHTYFTEKPEFTVYDEALRRQTARLQGIDLNTSIKTNIKAVDDVLGGFERGHLNVIGARPGQGKTTFMLNMINSMKGTKMVVFSLEMKIQELVTKLVFIDAEVNYQKYKQGELTNQDIQQIYGREKRLQQEKIYFDDLSAIRPVDMRLKLKRLIATMGVDVVFIDYLQLMNADEKKHENNQVKVASISRELKRIAKELNVAIVALAQVNRGPEQNQTVVMPKISDLRESGAIEADADTIMLLHCPSYYNPTNLPGILQVNIGKNRFGQTKVISLAWNKTLGKIQDQQQLKEEQDDKKPWHELSPNGKQNSTSFFKRN